VAVHADTGEYAWHYQTSTPERQTENFHIVLADVPIGGRVRHVAMSAARNGTYYVLDAENWEVGQSDAVWSSRAGRARGWITRAWWSTGWRTARKLFRRAQLVADEL